LRPLLIPCSYGEAADKFTILTIKSERMRDAAQIENIRAELSLLREALFAAVERTARFDALLAELKTVNETLWTIEDDIRALEAKGEFGPQFVRLARGVYRNNDERARIKRRIDELLGSPLREEKSYKGLGLRGDS
jgi:predicted  nucleic acid-binding Zn-ribbon protein